MINTHFSEIITIKGLYIYPIKSCAGIEQSELLFEDLRGAKWDRRWMFIDENNLFHTQRQSPQMACIKTKLLSDALVISVNESPSLIKTEVILPFSELENGRLMQAKVWKRDVNVFDCGDLIAKSVSQFLGKRLRLVYLNPEAQAEEMSLADSYPILLTNTASLGELSKRVGFEIPMSRFRANVVVSSHCAFVEDEWKKLKIGGIEIHETTHCSRCVIINTDQKTGVRAGAEPLKTLSSFRKIDQKVNFGRRMKHLCFGKIKVGDEIIVLESL